MTKSKKGILLIDKPKEKTSPEVTQEISELTGVKAGHCGALDPFATGILPIALGKAVKIQEYLQKKDKEYYVEIKTEKEVPEKEMKKKLESFKGKIKQIPPEKSAVKREERERQIYNINYLEKKGKKHIFTVEAQHGTYIRTLAKDLGEKLDTETELVNLRRIKSGKWNVKQSNTIEELKEESTEELLIPLEEALYGMPKIEIKKTALDTVKHGANLKKPGIKEIKGNLDKGEPVALEFNEKIIAIGEAQMNQEETQEKDKGIVVKTTKVISDSD